MEHWFYHPHLPGVGHVFTFDEVESRHLGRSLRKSAGDAIDVTDGRGLLVRARIEDVGKRAVEARVEAVLRQEDQRPHPYTLCVAPTKNIARFETLLEKATEIGIGAVVPIYTRHSERRRLKEDRCRAILVSAMKQSRSLWCPVWHAPCHLDDWLEDDRAAGDRFIAWLGEGTTPLVDRAPGPATVLIGPEGGFHPDEVAAARSKNYRPVHLGGSRLRTETAGIVAVVLLHSWHG